MKKKQHNTLLFTTLVAVSFLTVVAFWLPQFKDTVSGFSDSLNSAGEAFGGIKNQWNDAQEEMKKILPLDRAASAAAPTPTPESTQETKDVKQALESAVVDQLTSSSTQPSAAQESIARGAVDKRFRDHCTRRGGYHQERKGPNDLVYGVCVFAQGSECEEEMFFRDKCHIGQYSVAEDGIPRKPDLVILGAATTPCMNRLQTCFSDIVVTNRGWARSRATTLVGGETSYPITSLNSGETTTLDRTIPVSRVPSGQARIMVDPDDAIQEINEDNNTYYAPTEEQ